MNSHETQMRLPVEAYTSREWYDREMRELFGRNWQFAGMTSDLPQAGDFICINLGAFPMVALRAEKGELKAFHNICLHRGTQLLEVAGKRVKVIKCPYHDWVYSLDGQLIGVPQKRTQFPDLDLSQWRLHPGAIATWMDMIFVNPDPDATPFDEWLGDFPRHLGPHNPADLREVDARTYEVRANWKIFCENYIDVYHLAHLHSETLNMYDHARLESAVVGAGHVATYDPPNREYRSYLEQASDSWMPKLMPEPENWGAYTHLIFPNLGWIGTEYFWSSLQILPLAPDRTRLIARTRSLESLGLALTGAYEKVGGWLAQLMGYQPDANPLESGDFMLEDIHACEQQQKAMASPRFAFGPTSVDQEQLIIEFQRRVLAYMGEEQI